ncbi:hypothetical protein CPB84DRAFT_1794281 [Gymnopilus junonius]|uniref:Uncharacterized protein n=1 Tax=Gymnopilus junonius TaxID=109634 RepID=A0A9P5NE36_GYMJU|nr:hypothetical protein CPB84DRAFT_1794281 [Gymnopilus junonius]
MEGTGLPHYHSKDVPLDDEQILDSVSKHPLSNLPDFEPLYSNTGSFQVTEENRERLAVASTDNDVLNVDLKAMNASYGMLSSIADLSKLMQTFLDPNRPESLITPSTLREWLRPVHAWTDELTEVGLLWEIVKIPDTFGRQRRIYQKIGEFNGHYSAFAFNPTSGFGVIALMTVIEAFEHFQPVFDRLQVKTVTKEYAGTWKSKDGESEAIINVESGSLWAHKFDLKGNDILSVLREDRSEKMALASTGRKREFRLAKGYRPLTGWRHWGAMPYWVINSPGHCCGAPVDIIYFSDDCGEMVLNVPSAGVSLRRV